MRMAIEEGSAGKGTGVPSRMVLGYFTRSFTADTNILLQI
jgi:hypothetical protein